MVTPRMDQMGKTHTELSIAQRIFIENQKLFFVGTACADGLVNISPKGMDSLRIIDNRRILWLNVTGSSNETSAHVQENPRMTLMFASFDEAPLVLRLYGKAHVVHQNDFEWNDMLSLFTPLPGARQIFDLKIELVRTSCGMSVPYFEYTGERETLKKWTETLEPKSLQAFWRKKNQISMDGKPTHILEKSIQTEI